MSQVDYLEILRLWSLRYSKNSISASVHSSHHTVEDVLDAADAKSISWPMNETAFETIAAAATVLKLDFSSAEFAGFAEEHCLSEEAIEVVRSVFSYLKEKKQQTTVLTLLKMSRLPTKEPKTFENFDFSLLKGKDVERLKALPTLAAIYSHRNLAFIGPAGTGKTHLAQAFGYACCQHGMKTYFIKASELRDRFTMARRSGKTDSCLSALVRPSCLIVDEIGHCAFDRENTRLFFDLIDRRYNKEGSFNDLYQQQESRPVARGFRRGRHPPLCTGPDL